MNGCKNSVSVALLLILTHAKQQSSQSVHTQHTFSHTGTHNTCKLTLTHNATHAYTTHTGGGKWGTGVQAYGILKIIFLI